KWFRKLTEAARFPEAALVALGANQPGESGSPRDSLNGALSLLAELPGIAVEAASRWYRSPAFPPGSGPEFVNGAAVLRTALGPEALLAALHEVEARLGRRRDLRWGPRVCDLDLLAMGEAVRPDAATVRRWMDMAP